MKNNKLSCTRCKKEISKDNCNRVTFHNVPGERKAVSYTLCNSCADEFNEMLAIKKTVLEEPHAITNTESFLTQASREDIQEYLLDFGIDNEMAFAISERIRKGLLAVIQEGQ